MNTNKGKEEKHKAITEVFFFLNTIYFIFNYHPVNNVVLKKRTDQKRPSSKQLNLI
jgi:hypothetical protein